MRTNRRARTGGILGAVALAVAMTAGMAWANTSTELPGSILILPKIVADGTRDTLVEVSNTSNTLVTAHCYYVNGAPADPTQPPGPTNPPLWQEIDFFLFLTRQQPTVWQVSEGRDVNPFDNIPGFDPGLIPPVLPGFQGELVCIQVDGSGAPVGGNALTGSATLVGPGADSSKYNGIAVAGLDVGEDSQLDLDDVEYSACPTELAFTHFAQAVEDPLLGPGSEVVSRLSLVPCTHDFENQVPAQVGLRVFSYDEFEDQLSGIINFTCRFDAALDDPLQITGGNPFAPTGGIFGTWKYSRLVANNVCTGGLNPGAVCSSDRPCLGGTCDGVVGVVGILESAHVRQDGATSSSAQNLHVLETSPGAQIQDVHP